MSKHTATVELGVYEMPKAHVYTGISIRPRADGKNLGVLSCGQGGIYWKPHKKHYKNQKKLSWTQFAQAMDQIAAGAEETPE